MVEDLIYDFKDKLDVWDILKDFVLILYLIIPWVCAWVMRIIVLIICYTRVVEIYARATFAPIALSDFFHHGFQGAGWRFLKSFLAVCLQGAMILVISMIYTALFTGIQKEITESELSFLAAMGSLIAFMAATCMLMLKSLSLTKEMMGVN